MTREWRIVFTNGHVERVAAACMDLHNGFGEYYFYDSEYAKEKKIIARCPKEQVCFIKEIEKK